MQPTTEPLRVLLIAPNVSHRMGGEASKAFHIMTGLKKLGVDVVQITHERVQSELEAREIDIPIYFVKDDWLQLAFFRLRLNWLLAVYGSWLLHAKARVVARETRRNLIHFTSPISPTLPYFKMGPCPVVIGPLNGNILHPPKMLFREALLKRLGAFALWPYQKTIGQIFRGKHAATLLVSGGARTIKALKLAGCKDQQIIETLDSGVDFAIAERPRTRHEGVNNRFIFVGRLIRLKACDLVIRALADAPEAALDIVGDGEERSSLEQLAHQIGVADRVVFHGWVQPGDQLAKLLEGCRAFVFPSLCEANGIVVQEAMMIGLPVVAVNWGGPRQLIDATNGILIEPESEEYIAHELAKAMQSLGNDPQRAEAIASAARNRAEQLGFSWPMLLKSWLRIYERVASSG